MAAAQLEFTKQGSSNSNKYPIFVNKRKLEESAEDSVDNELSQKPKRLMFADDTGMPLSVEHIIPSISETGEKRIDLNNEVNAASNITKHLQFADDTGLPLSVEHTVPSINETEENRDNVENEQRLQENSEDVADTEVFLNPEHFLAQTVTTTDSDEEEAMEINNVISAAAETLITVSNVYDSGRKRVIFSCNVCEQEFRDRRSCIRHVRVHTGERPFKCLDCGESFGREDYLRRHLKSHSGEKDFACPICNKEFKRKDYLDEHLLLHNDAANRPFPCTKCDKGYVKRSHLERHMKTHSKVFEFACEKCGKGFHEQRNLLDHFNRKHSDKPKPTCEICFREFKSEFLLKTHMDAHKRKDAKEDASDESHILMPLFISKEERENRDNQ